MAIKTQQRFLQISGTLGAGKDIVPATVDNSAGPALASVNASDLSGILQMFGNAIANIHGKGDFSSQTPGLIDAAAGVNYDLELKMSDTTNNKTIKLTDLGTGGITADSASGKVTLNGGIAAADAIRIHSDNAAGGIDMDAGSGGFALDVTGGSFSVDATGTTAASNINHAGAAGQDLSVVASASSLNLEGGEADAAAVRVVASNAAGGIDIDAGTGGIAIDTTDGGAISIDAIGAPSNITLTSTAGSDDFTISLAGATDSSLILSSAGTGADAVQLTASAGGIDISGGSGGDVDISSNNKSINITASEAAANAIYIEASNVAGGVDIDCGNAGFDLDAALGQISLASTKVGAEAIQLYASAGTGELALSGSGGVHIHTAVAKEIRLSCADAIAQMAGNGIKLAESTDFATFVGKSLFTNATTIIGALNTLADQATAAPDLYAATKAGAAGDTFDVTGLDGATAWNTAGKQPTRANMRVYLNGQLLLSGSGDGSGAPTDGDYSVVNASLANNRVKFAFNIEADDVVQAVKID